VPQPPRGDLSALCKRLELRPRELRMHASAKPAVGRSDDVVAADHLGKTHDPVRDHLRVLDHVGRVSDDAGQDRLAVRQLDVLPHFPLVLVADVRGLERVGVPR
jgi:hypothetical protein